MLQCEPLTQTVYCVKGIRSFVTYGGSSSGVINLLLNNRSEEVNLAACGKKPLVIMISK